MPSHCTQCSVRFSFAVWAHLCAACHQSFCHECCRSAIFQGRKGAPQRLCDRCVPLFTEAFRTAQGQAAQLAEAARQYRSLQEFTEQLQSALKRKRDALDDALSARTAEGGSPQALPRRDASPDHWAGIPVGTTQPPTCSDDNVSVGHSECEAASSSARCGAPLKADDYSLWVQRQDLLRERLLLERQRQEVAMERHVLAAEKEGLGRENALLAAEVEGLGRVIQRLERERAEAVQQRLRDAALQQELQTTAAAQARLIAQYEEIIQANERQTEELKQQCAQLFLASALGGPRVTVDASAPSPPGKPTVTTRHHRRQQRDEGSLTIPPFAALDQ